MLFLDVNDMIRFARMTWKKLADYDIKYPDSNFYEISRKRRANIVFIMENVEMKTDVLEGMRMLNRTLCQYKKTVFYNDAIYNFGDDVHNKVIFVSSRMTCHDGYWYGNETLTTYIYNKDTITVSSTYYDNATNSVNTYGLYINGILMYRATIQPYGEVIAVIPHGAMVNDTTPISAYITFFWSLAFGMHANSILRMCNVPFDLSIIPTNVPYNDDAITPSMSPTFASASMQIATIFFENMEHKSIIDMILYEYNFEYIMHILRKLAYDTLHVTNINDDQRNELYVEAIAAVKPEHQERMRLCIQIAFH